MEKELKPVESPQVGHPYREGLQTENGGPFLVEVVYTQPTFEELLRQFPVYVDPDYKGLKFNPIDHFKNVLESLHASSPDVTFEYVHMNRRATTQEIFDEIDRRTLRPTLYEELISFLLKYPDEQDRYPIIALGSVANVGGQPRVANVWQDSRGRCLGLGWLHAGWNDDYRFLAVRD